MLFSLGYLALVTAVRNKNLEIAEYLLNYLANSTLSEPISGGSAIVTAFEIGDSSVSVIPFVLNCMQANMCAWLLWPMMHVVINISPNLCSDGQTPHEVWCKPRHFRR